MNILIRLFVWTNVVIGKIPKSGIPWALCQAYISFYKNQANCFPKWLDCLAFPRTPKCLSVMVTSFALIGSQAENTEVLLLLTQHPGSQNAQKQNSQALEM